MSTHIVIPDQHAHGDYHNKRFEWLGKLIADVKPDTVVNLGDMVDMPSLCTYDKGTKGYEGRRYKKDIESGLDAQDKMFHYIRKAKKKLPRFILLEGNHEHRITRAIEQDAAHLEGVISMDDLGFKDFGWEFVPYKGGTPGVKIVDGVAYAHYFTSGVMGRPIGGVHPAYQLIHKQYQSTVQGHTHTVDYSVRTAADGRMLHGLVAGVYQDYISEWAGMANDLWWRGLVILRGVNNGQFDPEFISLSRIKAEYS